MKTIYTIRAHRGNEVQVFFNADKSIAHAAAKAAVNVDYYEVETWHVFDKPRFDGEVWATEKLVNSINVKNLEEVNV